MRSMYKSFGDPGSFSYKKTLFKPLVNTEGNYFTQPKFEDKKQSFDSVLKYFPRLEKYDHKNISLYSEYERDKCHLALEAFKSYLTRESVVSLKILKDDVLKVFVITFNCFTSLFVSSESIEEMEASIKYISILNQFLLFTLGEQKNPFTLGRHDASIILIIKKALADVNRQLITSNKYGDSSLVAGFLCYQFQALAMIIALNEGRSFMKTAALDSIKVVLETFACMYEEMLANEVLRKVYEIRLGEDEMWVTLDKLHVKIAIGFSKKKFTIIQLNSPPENPHFSLRYMILYYILKSIRLLPLEENPLMKEKILKIVAVVLKDNRGVLTIKDPITSKDMIGIEIVLNEYLVLFNIIKRIIPKVGDPLARLDKFDYINYLIPIIEKYFNVVMRLDLMVKCSQVNDCVELSYKTTNDYLSGLFNFLDKVRDAKSSISLLKTTKSEIKGSTAIILNFIEEVTGKIVQSIDTIEGTEHGLEILKFYIIEYLFDNDNLFSKQTAEHILKLLMSTRFHFTSPKSLQSLFDSKVTRETSLENETNKRMVALVNKVMECDKIWAETILDHFITLIPTLLNDEESLFGICKFIYCGVTGNCISNLSFFNKLFNKEYEEVKDMRNIKKKQKEESKSIRGFVNIKGIHKLIDILLMRVYEDGVRVSKSENAVIMIEQLLLELAGLPLVAQQLLSEVSLPAKFLNYINVACDPRKITVKLLTILLRLVRQSEKINENDNYLPTQIIGYIRENTDKPKEALKFARVIINFLTQEANTPPITNHQLAINNIVDMKHVLKILEESNDKAYIGKQLITTLEYLNVVQRNNNYVTKKISNLIRNNKMYLLIKQKKVISYIITV